MIGPLVLDVDGLQLSSYEKRTLKRPHVGGVIFFSRNYQDPIQFRALVRSIRRIRPELILCVDQEGGRVQRFRTGLSRLPAMQRFGQLAERSDTKVSQLAQQCGWLMASELQALGVDISFAPVLDLDNTESKVIGDRAFSKDPFVTTALAHHFIKGMKTVGMVACAKHFPGHGSVVADSHVDVVTDNRSMEEIDRHDLVPFVELKQDYDALMPAHVIFPQVAPEPVGFSPHWIQDILRQRLGFQGIIFSDDLTMAAARYAGDVTAAALTALQAGCDAVLVCNQPEQAEHTLNMLERKDWPVKDRLSLLRKGPILWPKENALLQLHNSHRWQQAKQSLAILES